MRTMQDAAGPGEVGRKIVLVSNMGWDSDAADLEACALQLLAEAGFHRNAIGPVAPLTTKTGKGSACEVVFRSPADLDHARVAVRAFRREFLPGRVAWLDPARTRAKTRPLQAMYRLSEVIAEYEHDRVDKLQVHKDPQSKSISVGQSRVVFVTSASLSWTPYGAARYSDQQREDADAVAASA